MSTPKPIAGCYAEKCPKCQASSPCVDHDEVDIGIGFQTGNHEFYCPEHGAFAFVEEPGVFANFGAGRVRAVFRDEAEAPRETKHMTTTKKRCATCETEEEQRANACFEREDAAKAKGETYNCDCTIPDCTHELPTEPA